MGGGRKKEGGVTHCFCRRDSGVGGGGRFGVSGEKKGPIVAVCHLCDCALDRREGPECTGNRAALQVPQSTPVPWVQEEALLIKPAPICPNQTYSGFFLINK